MAANLCSWSIGLPEGSREPSQTGPDRYCLFSQSSQRKVGTATLPQAFLVHDGHQGVA